MEEQLFKSLRASWVQMGNECPWYSVLTGFPKTVEIPEEDKIEFYKSGQRDLQDLQNLFSVQFSGERVLDFGCGLGRLSFALAEHFTSVVGVDQSESHLKTAIIEAGPRGFDKKIQFLESKLSLEDMFGRDSFDFVISLITLQHTVPPLIAHYVRQFCKILKPNGKCFFQVPTFMPSYTWPEDTETALRVAGQEGIQMHALPMKDICNIIQQEGCQLLMSDVYDRIGIPGAVSMGIYLCKP